MRLCTSKTICIIHLIGQVMVLRYYERILRNGFIFISFSFSNFIWTLKNETSTREHTQERFYEIIWKVFDLYKIHSFPKELIIKNNKNLKKKSKKYMNKLDHLLVCILIANICNYSTNKSPRFIKSLHPLLTPNYKILLQMYNHVLNNDVLCLYVCMHTLTDLTIKVP